MPSIMDNNIVLPSKPKVVEESGNRGQFEIDGLYPGYGHTLGNSLRRIILSSLPGAAITQVKIDGVSHEFATIEGVKEDVINILLNLKKVCLKVNTNEIQTVTLKAKGEGDVTAGDIETPGQVEITNPDLHLATITDKNTELTMEMQVEKGMGFVEKEELKDGKVDVGAIVLDAVFSPIRRVNYSVEKMRVSDRTDFNRLSILIETDGTISPKEVLEDAITIMIHQLKAIVGFQEEEDFSANLDAADESPAEEGEESDEASEEDDEDFIKTRIESLELSTRTANALEGANIRTAGGLIQKTESDILDIDGLGNKGLDEIKDVLAEHGHELKSE